MISGIGAERAQLRIYLDREHLFIVCLVGPIKPRESMIRFPEGRVNGPKQVRRDISLPLNASQQGSGLGAATREGVGPTQ